MVLTLFLILLGGLAVGIPIAVALGFAMIFPGLTDPGFPASVAYIVRNVVSALDSTPMLAIPLFILSGEKKKPSGRIPNFSDFWDPPSENPCLLQCIMRISGLWG